MWGRAAAGTAARPGVAAGAAETRRLRALVPRVKMRATSWSGEEVEMKAHVGDRIVVESERASQTGRMGVIEEVLDEDHARVRVRWDDGHTSILTPSAGAATIMPAHAGSA